MSFITHYIKNHQFGLCLLVGNFLHFVYITRVIHCTLYYNKNPFYMGLWDTESWRQVSCRGIILLWWRVSQTLKITVVFVNTSGKARGKWHWFQVPTLKPILVWWRIHTGRPGKPFASTIRVASKTEGLFYRLGNVVKSRLRDWPLDLAPTIDGSEWQVRWAFTAQGLVIQSPTLLNNTVWL